MILLTVTIIVNKCSMLMLGVSEIELGEPWIVEMYVASTMWLHFARYLPVNQQHTCNNEFVTRPAKIDHVSAKKLPIFSVFAVS